MADARVSVLIDLRSRLQGLESASRGFTNLIKLATGSAIALMRRLSLLLRRLWIDLGGVHDLPIPKHDDGGAESLSKPQRALTSGSQGGVDVGGIRAFCGAHVLSPLSISSGAISELSYRNHSSASAL